MKNVAIVSLVLLLFLFTGGTAHLYSEVTSADCLGCHSDKDLEAETARGKTLKLFVPEAPLKGSVHEDVSCVDCHTGAVSFEDVPHAKKPLTLGCTNCHEDAGKDLSTSVHHTRVQKSGGNKLPGCNTCHGGHQIASLSSPDSKMSKKNQVETCGQCHQGKKLHKGTVITLKHDLVTRYKSSIHYQAIQEGKNAASCSDCHGGHAIFSSERERSKVSRSSVAKSCQQCHTIEASSYWTGVHGSALLKGNNDVPTCTTCHGDHDMASMKSRVGDSKQYAGTQVCMWCHGNRRMMKRYGLDSTPVESYLRDFHGLTQRGTLFASATCADCHDPHHSLPAEHPSSRVNKDNLVTTCGQCHGKVTEGFAASFSHFVDTTKSSHKVENFVRILYILLIVGAVGFMVVYCLIIWVKIVRDKIKAQKSLKHVERMSTFERVAHFILFITFSLLVFTGFALKYPDAWWSNWLFAIGVKESIRAFIHRFSALVMTVDLCAFMFYMFFAKRGRCVFKELLPAKRDFTDFFKTMKYYMGMTKEKEAPKCGVFSYADKFEFWALVWGTVVMLVTGLILWFPKAIPASWPEWTINVARIIHLYEAILATLAIIIWHGFHTVWHPYAYPMSTSWLTGWITDEEAKHHFEPEAIKKMTGGTDFEKREMKAKEEALESAIESAIEATKKDD